MNVKSPAKQLGRISITTTKQQEPIIIIIIMLAYGCIFQQR
jgi:hypothetical protein